MDASSRDHPWNSCISHLIIWWLSCPPWYGPYGTFLVMCEIAPAVVSIGCVDVAVRCCWNKGYQWWDFFLRPTWPLGFSSDEFCSILRVRRIIILYPIIGTRSNFVIFNKQSKLFFSMPAAAHDMLSKYRLVFLRINIKHEWSTLIFWDAPVPAEQWLTSLLIGYLAVQTNRSYWYPGCSQVVEAPSWNILDNLS